MSIDIPPAQELKAGKIVLIFCQDTSLVNLYAVLGIGLWLDKASCEEQPTRKRGSPSIIAGAGA